MLTRKPRSTSQNTVAKPTISVPPLAKQRSTKTLQNMLAVRLGILVTAAAAGTDKRCALRLSSIFLL
jgi:hypothetical protein